MVLAQIIDLALRQLDEDAADTAKYEAIFAVYANMGYQILLRDYAKPRVELKLMTDDEGAVCLGGWGIGRVLNVQSARGNDVGFTLSGDGERLLTPLHNEEVTLCAEEEMPPLAPGDAPRLPEALHAALADYICYRYLMTGNAARQARAEAFRQSFYTQARLLQPQGGTAGRMRNLYAATDIRGR